MTMNVTVYKVLVIGQGSLGVMAKPEMSVNSRLNPGAISKANPSAVFKAIANLGTTHLVSLLEPGEAHSLGLQDEGTLCTSQGMRFINTPIEDMTLPTDPESFVAMAAELHRIARQGGHVVIHCRAGIGRSGMAATAVLMHEGIAASTAIDIVTKARGLQIPDTDEQRGFIHQLEPLIKLGI